MNTIEQIFENGEGELTQAKFIELAYETECYKNMCDTYESEVEEEDEPYTDPPHIFYHEQYGWAWAWGGDAGRLDKLESDGDYSVTKGRQLKCLGSAKLSKLSSAYSLE